MLEKLVMAFLIGGLAPVPRARGAAGTDVVTDVKPADVLRLPAPAPRSAREAAQEFLRQMSADAAGGALQIKRIQHSYAQLAPQHGWPPMTTKALSMQLVKLGCKRGKADLRKFNQGRPTVLRFPARLAA